MSKVATLLIDALQSPAGQKLLIGGCKMAFKAARALHEARKAADFSLGGFLNEASQGFADKIKNDRGVQTALQNLIGSVGAALAGTKNEPVTATVRRGPGVKHTGPGL